MTLPIAPWEAALGAVMPVQTPGANLEVRIPAGAQSGREMRVRGKGIPGQPPGDLYLDLQVVLPPAQTPKARELYETMARPFNSPRTALVPLYSTHLPAPLSAPCSRFTCVFQVPISQSKSRLPSRVAGATGQAWA